MQQNKIFTAGNQPLNVQFYSLLKPGGAPQTFSTLEGVPLGTSDGSSTGELATKVVVVGSRGSSPNSSATGIVAVTPDDDNDIPANSQVRGLYVGSGGDISVVMSDGSTGIFSAVPTGMILPAQITRVLATGTTATDILALL